MTEKCIAWAITGAGHALEECVEVILKQKRVDIFLSRAADEVLRIYNLHDRLNTHRARICRDAKASSPLVGRLFGSAYSALVVAPATSNSVAKFVHGISDTLVTNLFAQSGKAGVPVIVYPTDLCPEVDSVDPHGKSIKIFPRAIDLDNTAKLRAFSGVRVVGNREELERCLATCL
jgi:dihydromethanopterin reductase (acceptor)